MFIFGRFQMTTTTLNHTNYITTVANKNMKTKLCQVLRKEGNVYLTTHSTQFIYGYMASDIW